MVDGVAGLIWQLYTVHVRLPKSTDGPHGVIHGSFSAMGAKKRGLV